MTSFPSVQVVMPQVRKVWDESTDLTGRFKLRLLGDGSAVRTGGAMPVWYSINIWSDADAPDVDQLDEAITELQHRIQDEIKAPVTLTMLAPGSHTNGTH